MPIYISEVDYEGGAAENFVEIVAPEGTDTSGFSLVQYDKDGEVEATLPLDSVVSTNANQDVYLIDDSSPSFNDIKNDEALALVDDTGTVTQFVSFKDAVTAVDGPASGMTSTQIGEHSGSQQSIVTANEGASYATTSTATAGTVPVCYCPGTMVLTDCGERAVEGLVAGDCLVTADHGLQPIRWIGRTAHCFPEGPHKHKPIEIKAGVLGSDLPRRTLIVSPQRRMLIRAPVVEELFGETEVLALAKGLVGLGSGPINGIHR
ncbi:MAG: Hint domain-containing protein [Pseudomonadota bacterium]